MGPRWRQQFVRAPRSLQLPLPLWREEAPAVFIFVFVVEVAEWGGKAATEL